MLTRQLALCWLLSALPLASGCHVADHMLLNNEFQRALSDHSHGVLGELPPCDAPVEHISFEHPDIAPPLTPANYLEAEELPMTLDEAIAISVTDSDIVRTIVGPGQAALAATGYDPTIQETLVQQALAAFDTSLSFSHNWSQDDQPGAPRFDRSATRVSLDRSFVTGTRGSIRFANDYVFPPNTIFPAPASYRTRLEYELTQPLLRGGGKAVNRAPLVIARAQSDSSVWDFKSALQSQVRSIETAYRDLYADQESVRVLKQVVDLSQEVVRVQKERVANKAAVEADLAQAESQLATFEQGLRTTITSLLRNETLLRNLLGWPASDGRRIVATDAPNEAPLIVDWHAANQVAMANRPDIARSRLSVLIREQLLVQARNDLMPQADLIALLRQHGEDASLDDSIDELLDGRFSDGLLGFSVALPLRNHGAGGAAVSAELNLARSRAVLRQTVHNASHDLTAVVRDLLATYQQYEAAAARLKATEAFLNGSRSRFENPKADSQLLLLLSVYLGALNDFATATVSANQLLSQYNVALARLEEAQGTLLQSNQIFVSEHPRDVLPVGLYDQYSRRFGCLEAPA